MYISDVKRAEYILQTNNFDKLSKALSLIIRYFIQIKDYNPLPTKEEARKFLALNKQNKHESNVNDSLYHHYKRKCEEQLEIINGMSKNIDLLQSKLDDIKTDNT